jgi:hypothetical protein
LWPAMAAVLDNKAGIPERGCGTATLTRVTLLWSAWLCASKLLDRLARALARKQCKLIRDAAVLVGEPQSDRPPGN